MKYFLLVCIASTTSLVCKESEYKSSQELKQERNDHYNKAGIGTVVTVLAAAETVKGAATCDPVTAVCGGVTTVVAGSETINQIKEGYQCNKEYHKAAKIERDVERQIESQYQSEGYSSSDSFCDSARGQ